MKFYENHPKKSLDNGNQPPLANISTLSGGMEIVDIGNEWVFHGVGCCKLQ